VSAPRYNTRPTDVPGESESDVPGWTVTYPASCNGHLGDIAFIASRGFGGSGFVHFDHRTGQPYGFTLTAAARERLIRMRRDNPRNTAAVIA
jgi:hypothetical protein